MRYIQTETNTIRLRQVGKNFMLVMDRLTTMGDLERQFARMLPKEKPVIEAASRETR
jgi:hypothetical protein